MNNTQNDFISGIGNTPLIKDAQEKKLITKGGTVVEGTAGNTGIGLGLLGNSLITLWRNIRARH